MTKAEFDMQLVLLGWARLPAKYTKRDAYTKNDWTLFHDIYPSHKVIRCSLIKGRQCNHFANYRMCMEKVKKID